MRVDGVTKETITHGIGSVFCYPEHRGKGYPKKMLNLLGTELATWQAEEGECYFSFLYSDIGKSFYTKLGWHAHPSKHLMWTPSKTEVPSGEVCFGSVDDLSFDATDWSENSQISSFKA